MSTAFGRRDARSREGDNGKAPRMPGETLLHKTLKKEACRWLLRCGYRCIAAEVRVRPIGIIDAVGTGIFRPYHNYLGLSRTLPQVCFIEAKASRADFLRDCGLRTAECGLGGDEPEISNLESEILNPRSEIRNDAALGKFKSCLARPMANLHYVIAPAGLIQKKELPPRWGLLAVGEAGVCVVVRAEWQEAAAVSHVESAIARTLTDDIYRADARALNSVNREVFSRQQALAERIRSVRPQTMLSTVPYRPA